MPYIQQRLRDEFDPLIDPLIEKVKTYGLNEIGGILNYTISRIVAGSYGPDWRYSKIESAMTTFEDAKLEFYTRVARPYEDRKIAENGDLKEYRNV